MRHTCDTTHSASLEFPEKSSNLASNIFNNDCTILGKICGKK